MTGAPGSEVLSADAIAAFSKRRHGLADALDGAGAEALLVGHAKDIRYLTGFVGDDSLLLVTGSGGDPPTIITDARHDGLLEPWRRRGAAVVVIGTRHRLGQAAASICAERGLKRIAVQAEHLTLAAHRGLADALRGIDLVETEGLVGRLRMCKDALEIACIEQAVSMHEAAMAAALVKLAPGMTEREFCAVIEYEMKTRGASGPSFGTCVAAGANSAVIHYEPGPARIEPGVLLLDWGAVCDGYCSDMTRTFGVGRLPPKIRELYDIVLEAQQAAIEACAPGRTGAEIDGVARGVIKAAGYGEHFGHGLGHGLGLDIHEAPWFNELATDTVMAPGMVMTVEPGIYLPGEGGVRIEDDVLITGDGCRVLTSFPKDPESAALEPAAGRVPAV